MVEASIRYLPLYPDDNNALFNDKLLRKNNILATLLPDCKKYEDTVFVVKTDSIFEGHLLRILMNADIDRAVAVFTTPDDTIATSANVSITSSSLDNDHAAWRLKMVQKMAKQLDTKHFGVEAMYLTGSTQNKTASPGSDIDLVVKFIGNPTQKNDLKNWFQGWSLCLDEINYQRTGCKVGGLLDVEFVEEIPKKSSRKNGNLLKL